VHSFLLLFVSRKSRIIFIIINRPGLANKYFPYQNQRNIQCLTGHTHTGDWREWLYILSCYKFDNAEVEITCVLEERTKSSINICKAGTSLTLQKKHLQHSEQIRSKYSNKFYD
jgi:hypothetical protein